MAPVSRIVRSDTSSVGVTDCRLGSKVAMLPQANQHSAGESFGVLVFPLSNWVSLSQFPLSKPVFSPPSPRTAAGSDASPRISCCTLTGRSVHGRRLVEFISDCGLTAPGTLTASLLLMARIVTVVVFVVALVGDALIQNQANYIGSGLR